MATIWIDLAVYREYGDYTTWTALLAGNQSPPAGSELRIDWASGGMPEGGSSNFYGYQLDGVGVTQDYRGSTFLHADDVYVTATDSTFYFDALPGVLRAWIENGVSQPVGGTFHLGDSDDAVVMGGTSTVYGGGGNDTIKGAAYASGGAGDDRFAGVAEVHGGGGDDLVGQISDYGWVGTFYGGAGFDEVKPNVGVRARVGVLDSVERVSSYRNLEILTELLPAGELSIDAYFAGIELVFDDTTITPNIILGDVADTVLGPATFDPGYARFRIDLAGGDDVYRAQARPGNSVTVLLGDGADLFRGASGIDDVYGGGDDDDIAGGAGGDWLRGSYGDDLIRGGLGDDGLFGGEQDDVIRGHRGHDLIAGDEGPDDWQAMLYPGDDQLHGGLGRDHIYGGGGADSLYGDGGRDQLEGGAGDDSLYGGGGKDRLWGDEGADQLSGGVNDDRLYGGGGSDTAWGGDGADRIAGDDGADLLHGDAGDDTIEGGAGDDILHGDDGDDWLYGGAGADEAYGGDGADALVGGEGTSELFGGLGADLLTLGVGATTATGGAGADEFVAAMGDGADTILDFETGLDRIRIVSGATGFDQLDIAQRGAATYVTYGLNTDVLALIGVSAGDLDASDFLFGSA
ncbi:calcium-binding protein [Albimonas pacifica]|uniref:Hemolysin-type calcium-binding repeat-containing protein n=1 Tax=Albimonas pacifica TaxID=1114924 RepID=A0A1I3EGQ8_9RHOB|nr:calcium-binding protein [Albimonas pacifica]SFH98142.1 Hemolysin-type calcium-binding repeat-containing protein [Albimonas pacifica]